ncbi:MAG: Asp-tRNA(Asn)/Glu-tRNA(Gln) amidotransferase subunit GatC [Campylobacterota bacterium]|nr:Asp-tRNA(Asn)/Glu-tRNA(Gln) amidotransferase subunit GatC [Campylobacterota bacterium]
MLIDNTTIDKLAKLSSLTIDDSKKEKLAKELEEIVGFVENLNEIDVSSVDATFTTVSGGQPLREDNSFKEDGLSQRIMKNAPKTSENYFIVPTIIE